MRKAHQTFTKQKETILKLENEVKSVKTNLLSKFSMKALSKITSSVRNINHVVATGPCLSKKSSNEKKKIGEMLSGIPMFKEADIEELTDNCFEKGQFGKLNLVKIKRLNTVVVSKALSPEKSTKNDVLAEVIVGLTISGEKYFPYVFGMLNQFSILMEYLGDLTESEPVVAQNLFKKSRSLSSFSELKPLLIDSLNGVMCLHSFKILHNDIKADNFVCAKDCVKLVDFGKATLISHPKTYNILPRSELAEKYNKHHRHLAHELRNVPGSKQSILTDTYSIGYMFKHIAGIVHDDNIITLARSMKIKEPGFRISLKKALDVLIKL